MKTLPTLVALAASVTAWAAAPAAPAAGQEIVKDNATRTVALTGDGDFRVEGGGKLLGTVDAPGGALEIRVGGGSTVRLTGRVRTVVLHLVDGQSTVNLSGLKADRVAVRGDVNGSSDVSLNAAAIDFAKTIDGKSTVTVVGAKRVTGKVINGGSTLTHNAGAACTFESKDGGAKVVAAPE